MVLSPDPVTAIRPQVVGRDISELPTPCLLVDLDALIFNLDLMAARAKELGVILRPHAKGHKSPRLAQMQVDRGAVGVTVATVGEAAAMLQFGIPDVFIANQIVGPGKLDMLMHTSTLGRLSVAIDDPANVRELAAAACASGTSLGVLVEVDIGMGRAGVRSASEAAELGLLAQSLDGIHMRGVHAYEGHVLREPEPVARAAKIGDAIDKLTGAVSALEAAGVQCEVVTAGGTGSYAISATDPRLTDLQAGSYALMDAFHRPFAPEFAMALTVGATIVSSHSDTFVADIGRKSVAIENGPPEIFGTGRQPRYLAEEHALFDSEGSPLPLGEFIRVIPGYGPSTANLYAMYFVVRGTTVVDAWPIVGRAPMLPGASW
jgi:D-serine deaminase-like pyridoxal phosphate-dependent protein